MHIDLKNLLTTQDRDPIEALCRAKAQYMYQGDHRAICRVLTKFLMQVDSRDLSLAPHLALNGCWEMWVTMAIAARVKPGMTCIDVGANFGYYTLLLAELVGPTGRVEAWEPLRNVMDCLLNTITINGFNDRTKFVAGAAGMPMHEGQEAVMVCLKSFFGGARVSQLVTPPFQKTRYLSLDTTGLKTPIDFIKIDVEGSEALVWDGMRRILAESPNLQVLMEFTPKDHAAPEALLQQIENDGFRLLTVGHEGALRNITRQEAIVPDTGNHRMLWLSRFGSH